MVSTEERRITCKGIFEANAERVQYFKQRIDELGRNVFNTVIVLICVDDYNGGVIAEKLMPGHDWQQYRNRGETPFARGLAEREGMQNVLESLNKDAADVMRDMENVVVIVIDAGTAEVFSA